MPQELSCFYFPYFIIPDELLKLGVLYYDKIYIDLPSKGSLNIALDNLATHGSLAKYTLGQTRAIQKAIENYETQLAGWKASGLLDSGIVIPSVYDDRLDSLPSELMDKLWENDHKLLRSLPNDLANSLMEEKLRVWQMAGSYHLLRRSVEFWNSFQYPAASQLDERMPVEIEEEFQDLNVPDKAFIYRSEPKSEIKNAIKASTLRSIQKDGPDNCFMPAYLPLLAAGVIPWVANTTAEKLLTYHFPLTDAKASRTAEHIRQNDYAISALSLGLPSLSFRSFEEVLEARHLCKDALNGYRSYLSQLVAEMEANEEPMIGRALPRTLLHRLDEELNELKLQVSSTKMAFIRDAAKRAAPVVTTFGLQFYLNSPLIGVIGAALGTSIAMLLSAYEAHATRKKLLYSRKAHGLSFMLRLQRSLR